MERNIGGDGDSVIETLAGLFAEHPAWRDAARRLTGDAESDVYFTHRPDAVWHLASRGDEILLLPGASDSPDFVFRFTPGSVAVLEALDGGIGDFAVTLFELLDSDDADHRVELRVVASFLRLLRRGYVRLLFDAGPAVLAYGARRGIRTLPGLKRLVDATRSKERREWEIP